MKESKSLTLKTKSCLSNRLFDEKETSLISDQSQTGAFSPSFNKIKWTRIQAEEGQPTQKLKEVS